MNNFQEKLNSVLQNSIMPVSALIGNCKTIENSSLHNPNYFPFYYHLGKVVDAKSILDTDFYLGLKEVCFLKSCKSILKITGIVPNHEEYKDLGVKYAKDNIKNVRNIDVEIAESLSNIDGSWDLIFCDNPSFARNNIQKLWGLLCFEGLLVIGNIYKNEEEFSSIAVSVNRVPVVFERYKVGIIQR